MSVVFLMGPTASGKTALAMELAARFPCEIICVDSAQVYRGMDIGTAKPTLAQRAQVPHHLLDLCEPSEIYSAARFCDDAVKAIAQISARGKLPLLVGGTMLYFRTLQEGLSPLPRADAAVRQRIAQQARIHGWPALHARLGQLDAPTAAKLKPNDSQRIQRALEVYELSGQPLSALQAVGRSGGLAGPIVKIGLCPAQRDVLHQRIAERFHQLMQQGFLDEVRRLHATAGLNPDLPSLRSVGYRQLWAHLEGQYDLPTAIERGVAATRQLAKRQITWLRSESQLNNLDPSEPNLVGKVLRALEAGAEQG
ncbi:MAG: tRNA (adenosine(37)-N6)-dimethylallyltransferase MiaA [Pseudomonadota bacterium]|mgnify:CR=1 FL=1